MLFAHLCLPHFHRTHRMKVELTSVLLMSVGMAAQQSFCPSHPSSRSLWLYWMLQFVLLMIVKLHPLMIGLAMAILAGTLFTAHIPENLSK